VLVVTSQIDPLLVPFLNAADAVEEGTELSRLNTEHIEPTIRGVLRYRLQFHLNRAELDQSCSEIEEVYHDVQLRLLKRLRVLKQNPKEKSIVNLRSYVATIARNTCDEYLRHKYPLRRSLKDKVRYCLHSHADFKLWESEQYGWLASHSACDSEFRSVAEQHGLDELLRKELHSVAPEQLKLEELLRLIFRLTRSPLELDHLTALVARLLRVEDHNDQSFDASEYSLDETVEIPATQAAVTEQRQLLELLWGDICELPRRHRVALLLNLRSPRGVNVILLLPTTGVATFEEIARALEIPSSEFELIWGELPLDDLRIATYLGVSRQQVINMRKTARDRLLRSVRLRGKK
jgi:DNA-directed RNA polymerase specialized sigma24 family protein